jgi:hypothetical protein
MLRITLARVWIGYLMSDAATERKRTRRIANPPQTASLPYTIVAGAIGTRCYSLIRSALSNRC